MRETMAWVSPASVGGRATWWYSGVRAAEHEAGGREERRKEARVGVLDVEKDEEEEGRWRRAW